MTTTDRPLHPVAEMTSSELDGYRKNLEHGITVVSEDGPTRELLQKKLATVLEEQEERRRIRRANGS